MKIIIVIPCGISIKRNNKIVVSSSFKLVLDKAINLNDDKSLICIPSGNKFGFSKSEHQCAQDYLKLNSIENIFISNYKSSKYIDTFDGINQLMKEIKYKLKGQIPTIISYSYQTDRVYISLKKLEINNFKLIRVKPSNFIYFEFMPIRQIYYICILTHFFYEIVLKLSYKFLKLKYLRSYI